MMNLDEYFLSYNNILKKLKENNIKTKNGKVIEHKDLRAAIQVMIKKHSNCRWFTNIVYRNKKYILIEGYYWLSMVYFQKGRKQIDADIEFFEIRIKQYEELLKIKPKKVFETDLSIEYLPIYFKRSKYTINKVINSIESKYMYDKENTKFIYKEGIEYICKKYFKFKYLEILEKYKMELTDVYIEKGYIFDNYF